MKSIKIYTVLAFTGVLLCFICSCKKDDKDLKIEYGSVTDIDGNIYKTVKIGTQWWMAENLKTVRYNNGDSIPNVKILNDWIHLTVGAYCNYDNDENNVSTYGRLYNWYTLNDERKLAPTGWHISTDLEWDILTNYLGGEVLAGGRLKETNTLHWKSPNSGANNLSGFTALPGGFRQHAGPFISIGYIGVFWTDTEYGMDKALKQILWFHESYIEKSLWEYKNAGLSIRCVKN